MSVDARLGSAEPSILRAVARHKLLIVTFAIAFGAIGLLVFSFRAAKYAAEAGVLLEDPRATPAISEVLQRDEDRYVADQISILKSPALLAQASQLNATASEPEGASVRALQRNMTIRTTEGSNYIVVRYQAGNPTTAMLGANSIVKAYRELVQADIEATTAASIRRLDAAIEEVVQRVAASKTPDEADALLLQQLQSRRSRLQVDRQLAGDGVALFSPAAPGRRQGVSRLATFALGLVLGGLIGVGFAYALDVRELRLSRRIGPRIRLRVPLLAEIPDFAQGGLSSPLPVRDAPGTGPADSFRFLAAAVGLRRDSLDGSVSAKLAESLQDEIPGMTDRELAVLDQVASRLDKIAQESQKPASRRSKSKRDLMLRSVAFVAAAPGDGTTTLAANTALAAAQEGDRVLMLDGDLWGRGLTQLLFPDDGTADGNGRRVGLTDMLLRGPLPEGIQLVTETPAGGSLSLIEPGATTLQAINAIRTELIRPGLDATQDEFDRIFIDVPPILQFPYSDPLVTSADGVVVVARHRGDVARLEQLLDRLDLLGVRPIGQVSNFVPMRQISDDLLYELRSGIGKLTSAMSQAQTKARARKSSRKPPRRSPGHDEVHEDALEGDFPPDRGGI